MPKQALNTSNSQTGLTPDEDIIKYCLKFLSRNFQLCVAWWL